MAVITKKICMLGDFGVGKTSLIRRFVEQSFSDEYLSTVGVKLSRKSVTFADSEAEAKLLIWDIEGQTKFKAIAASYLQGAAGVVIVGDVTRSETIQHFQDHLQLFYGANPDGKAVLVLNKTDLIEPQVSQKLDDFLHSAIDNVLGIYQASAKTGRNVDAMFETLAKELIIAP
ncbi:MAG: Rab family GTPase [Limnothrix sp.]